MPLMPLMKEPDNLFQFLIDIALSVDSLQELIIIICERLSLPICFKDTNGAMYIESNDPLFTEHMASYPLEELRLRYFISKICERERVFGYLLLPKSLVDGKEELVNASILAIRVYCVRKRAEAGRLQSAESDLLQRFLTRKLRIEKVLEEFKGRPFPLEGNSMVAVIGLGKNLYGKNTKEHEALVILDEKFGRFFKRYVTWHERNKIIIAFTPQFPMDEEAACDFIVFTLENVKKREETKEIFENLYAGFGSVKKQIEELPESYDEAERAFRAACLKEDGWWRRWPSLGALRLLMLFADHAEADKFIQSILGKLIGDDMKGECKELFLTLQFIENNSWNLKQTSTEMNFHYNTLKYRYQRIQEILNLDLTRQNNRFNIALALKLYSLRGKLK